MNTLTKEQTCEFLVGKIAMITGFTIFLGGLCALGMLLVYHNGIVGSAGLLIFFFILTLGLFTVLIMDWPNIRTSAIHDIQNPQPLSEQDYFTD